ncbi:cation transporter [Noviherbaspirillum aerium]|uniref:cation transporter n=1 Tax=Noviherbaspirillum aerium TaxID=2588497 RepID=UPI00124C264B|nr:cation transporter [Noviherbaspirillum aerium]
MSAHCCAHNPAPPPGRDPRYRRVLWIALLVNAAMFGVEFLGGMRTGSTSLLADALDFFGDAANYGVSLLVLSMALAWRSRAALLKGLSMGAFGCFVLARTAWSIAEGTPPEPATMGAIGFLALLANLGVAALLYAYRSGDANMRSVWLCTRNDAIGNAAVMLAAAGVFGTGSGWPDWSVAILMSLLALSAAFTVGRSALAELGFRHDNKPKHADSASHEHSAPHSHAGHRH